MFIIRSILAIIVGAVVMFVVVAGVHLISGTMHPMPVGLSMQDKAAMSAWMRTLPTSAFAMVLTAYVLGSLIGGGVSALIAGWAEIVHAGIIGALVLAGVVLNFREFGAVHPSWMVLSSYLLPLPVSLLVGWLLQSKTAAPKLERT